MHANKIRRFVARVNGCSVINECDSDFGRIVTPADVAVSVNVSARLDQDKLSHLDDQQRVDRKFVFTADVVQMFLNTTAC